MPSLSNLNRQSANYHSADAIQYLKALAILLFVYMQAQRGLFRAGLPVGNEFFHLLDSILNTIILPLGFAITGWVFATASSLYSRKDNTLTLIDTVIYPYVLWVMVQGFFQTQFNFLTQTNYSFIHIVSLLPIEPYGHFHYLYATFFCAILCMLFIRRDHFSYIAFGLIVAAAIYLYRELFNNTIVLSVISIYLFFFVLGVGLSQIKQRILSASALTGIIALCTLLFGQWLFHGFLKSDPYIYSEQVILVGAVSIISLFFLLGALSKNLKSQLFLTIGKAAFAIYLLHFLLVGGVRVLLIDVFSIEHVWLNLGLAFGVAIIGGFLAYYFSEHFNAHYLWRAPFFLSAHSVAGQITQLWQKKPISKPLSFVFIVLLLSPFVGVYALSELKINQKYERAPASNISLSTDSDDIANGKRLAQIYGCYLGCHAPEMQGQVLEDRAFKGRVVAPNLTKSIDNYSIDELDVIIRQGLLPNNKALRGWMPTEAHQYIDDASLRDILSFIASAPKQNRTPKPYRLGWLSRLDLLSGDYEIHHELAKSLPFDAKDMSTGERLARSACGECHGADLSGNKSIPSLQIVKAYSLEEFKTLQKTGIALGNREVGLMSLMGRNRFSLFTDAELESIYDYLSEL